MINDYAQKMFGTSPADEFALYGCEIGVGVADYYGVEIQKAYKSVAQDKSVYVTLEYFDGQNNKVVKYVGTDIYTPTKFLARYTNGSELFKDYADEKIYRVLCDELDADENVESYILYLPDAPIKTDDGYKTSAVIDYSFADGKPHTLLGSLKTYKDKQTLEFECAFKVTDGKFTLLREIDFEQVVITKTETAFEKTKTYRVMGEDAIAIMNVFGAQTEQSACDCMPTYTVTFKDKTYNVAIGDALCSHFSIGDQKHRFTSDEYKNVTALFEKCVTDQNFISEDIADGLQWSGEIEVTAYILDLLIQSGKWTKDSEDTKKFKITKQDAYSVYKSIKSKTFAEDSYRLSSNAVLEINGEKYWVVLEKDMLSITNQTCGLCTLEQDDVIVTILNKYIGFDSDYNETDDGVYVTYDNGYSYEKYITKQQAIDIALAESKVNEQNWVREFYYDPVFKELPSGKVIELLCGCNNPYMWNDTCMEGLGADCKRVWLVYLRSKNYPRKYGCFFINYMVYYFGQRLRRR